MFTANFPDFTNADGQKLATFSLILRQKLIFHIFWGGMCGAQLIDKGHRIIIFCGRIAGESGALDPWLEAAGCSIQLRSHEFHLCSAVLGAREEM